MPKAIEEVSPPGMAAWRRAMHPLWVTGVAVLLLLAGDVLAGRALGLREKTYDWAIYGLVGLGVPALTIVLPLLWWWRGWPAPWAPRLRVALAAVALVGMAAFIAVSANRWGWRVALLALALATVQTAVVEGSAIRGADPRTRARIVVAWVASLLGWFTVCALPKFGLAQTLHWTVALAAGFLVTVAAVRPGGLPIRLPRQPGRIATVVALLVILLFSLRTEHLFTAIGEGGAIHHWGAWTGTVDLMRQGGWLLWDTPAHYGFLSMIVLAIIPAPTWTAFYLASAAAFFVVGAGVFAVGRGVNPGWPGWLFGLVTGCVVPMYFSHTLTHVLPNYGAYRYLPGFLLLLVLAGEALANEYSPSHRRLMAGGCILWLIGVLWGPDSMVYCTAAWLPAYAVMSVRQGARADRPVRTTLAWLALPVVLLAAALAIIAIVWRANLGAGPDWIAFLDYVIGPAATEALVAKQVLLGSGMLLLVGFSVVAVPAAVAGAEGGPTRWLAFWVGLLGLFWGVAIYTHQRAVGVLQPIGYAIMLVALAAAARAWTAGSREWPPLVRAAVVPLILLPIAPTLDALVSHPGAPAEAARSLAATARHGFAIEWMMPDADPALQQLLRDAGVTADTPLVYAGSRLGNLMMPWTPEGATERTIANPQWTPNHPATMGFYLPDERNRAYLERFLARNERGGWAILAKTGEWASAESFAFSGGLKSTDVFYDTVMRTMIPTTVLQDADWQIMLWEVDGGQGVRPELPDGGMRPLPADVVVDGVALSQAPAPEVWAMFGAGWRSATQEGRSGSDGATMWVYSPDARTVRFSVPVIGSPKRVTLRLNGSGTTGPDGAVEADVALQPGWNEVAFTLVEAPPPPRANSAAAAREPKKQGKQDAERQKGRDRVRSTGATPEPVPAAATPERKVAATPEAGPASGDAAMQTGQAPPPRRFTVGPIRIATGD